jgi:hypothetical protein
MVKNICIVACSAISAFPTMHLEVETDGSGGGQIGRVC